MNLHDLHRKFGLDEAFHGRYEILGVIGEGGMGVVVRAQQRSLDRPVAIKFLRNDVTAFDEKAVQRFVDEARLTASLHHRNVVEVYAVDRCGETGYIVYEFVEGRSLRTRLDEKKRLSPLEAFRVVHQSALGLAHAHQQGVIHRDVKPDNLLITPAGVVKVADFGLAKHDSSKTLRTQRGIIMGTPEYLAPERIDGKKAMGASDVYALGIVLYECLTGQPPFLGASMDVLIAHLRKPVPPIHVAFDGLPAEAEELLERTLAKKPEARGTALDLARDVEGLLVVLQRRRASGPLEPVVSKLPSRRPSVSLLERSSATRSTHDLFGQNEDTGLNDPVVEELVRGRRRRRWAAASGAVAALLLVLLFVLWPRPYAYEDLAVELHEDRGILRFRSRRAWPTRVEGEGLDLAVDRRGEALRDHRVEFTGIEPGRRYSLHVVYPDGRRSDPIFVSTTRPWRNFRLGFPEEGVVEATWRTASPTRCRGEMRQGARGSWISLPGEDGEGRVEHRLRFDLPKGDEACFLRIVSADGVVTWVGEPISLRFDAVLSRRVAASPSWKRVVETMKGRHYDDRTAKPLRVDRAETEALLASVERRRPWIASFLGDPNLPVEERFGLVDSLQRLRLFAAFVDEGRRGDFDRLEDLHRSVCDVRVLEPAEAGRVCRAQDLLRFYPPSSFFVPVNLSRKLVAGISEGGERLVTGVRHLDQKGCRLELRPLRPDVREVQLVFRLSLFLVGSVLRLELGEEHVIWLVPRKAFSVQGALDAFRSSGAFMSTPDDIEENFPPDHWSVTIPASVIGRNGSTLTMSSLAVRPDFFRFVSIRSVHLVER